MRAMSLAAESDDSDQNELRNLQTQLESTNLLVLTLSQQLAELKDQVGFFHGNKMSPKKPSCYFVI